MRRWLARHRRFEIPFTPTSSSWLNTVERFFRDLTHNRLRRGVFLDVEDLISAIEDYIDKYNENLKAFGWTAKPATSWRKSNAPARHWRLSVDLLAALH